MNLFRKRNATTPSEPGERHCRGCGSALAEDQLACLECGAVDVAPTGRDRRWLLPTGGVIGVALFLVTSASFAATTALNTGDPEAIKPKPPAQVAQAPLPPASGDGTVPESSQNDDSTKGPDLGDLPSGGGGGAAPPADSGGSDDAPADDGGGSGGSSGGSDSGGSSGGGSNGGGSNGGSGGSNGGGSTTPDNPPPVKVSEWPDTDGYTVIVYKFDSKSDAKQKAQEVAAKGLPAGILDSDKYASLTPGSWLVYIGEFDSQKKAEKAATKYENAGYPGEVTFVGQSETPESDPSADGAGTTTTPQP